MHNWKWVRKIAMTFAAYGILIFGISFLLICFVGQKTVVVGSSMEPTLSDGNQLLVDKLSYRFTEPKRFDVIVFPDETGQTCYIKRVIALPGESIRIDDEGKIYINGNPIEESYGLEAIEDPGLAKDEIRLKDGEYFVLGDNRNNSSDSRFSIISLVTRKQIVGKAFFRIYPFRQTGFIH